MLTSPPRAAGINLVLFFAFALCALVMLTRTLVSVTQVQTGVTDAVQPATSGIVDDTALLSRLNRTNRLTAGMLREAQGLNGSLGDVAGATQQIDSHIAAVRAGTARIDASVAGIAASSADVQRRVARLHADVSTTDRTAAEVASRLAASGDAVAPLGGSLDGARSSVESLLALVPAITREAAAITGALSGVDRHLTNVLVNGLVRLTNLVPLPGLLSLLGKSGG